MISGPNQVEIGSKSGPGFSWVGAGGVGPGGRVPVAPRKVPRLRACRSSRCCHSSSARLGRASDC